MLDGTEARGAEVARAARLSPSATSAALRVLAEHGLAERGRGGWRRGAAGLDEVAESTGAADIHQERAQRYQAGSGGLAGPAPEIRQRPQRHRGTGRWLAGLDDEDEWAAMLLSRWPVLRRRRPRPAAR